MTMIGPKWDGSNTYNSNFKSGAHIRRNSEQSIFNSIFMGWPTGIKIDGDSCHRNADSSWLALQNNIVSGSNLFLDSIGPAANTWPISAWFNAAANSNTIYSANTSVMLTSPHSYSAPDFRPSAGSPALTGASFTNAKLASGFDNTPTYRGAFGTTNWLADWTSFSPETNPYEEGVGPLSIHNQILQDLQVNLIPNPTQQNTSLAFNVKSSSEVMISILDINGRIVFETSATAQVGRNNIQLPTSNLQNGIYFVKLQVNQTTSVTKLNIIK